MNRKRVYILAAVQVRATSGGAPYTKEGLLFALQRQLGRESPFRTEADFDETFDELCEQGRLKFEADEVTMGPLGPEEGLEANLVESLLPDFQKIFS